MLQDDLRQAMLKVTNGRLLAIGFEDEVLAVLICGVDNESVSGALTIASVFIFAHDRGTSTFKGKSRIA